MKSSLTLKELHAQTGALVRKAGVSRRGVTITDRGEIVALLSNPSLVSPRKRTRILRPGYAAYLATEPTSDVLEDLDAVRGDR